MRVVWKGSLRKIARFSHDTFHSGETNKTQRLTLMGRENKETERVRIRRKSPVEFKDEQVLREKDKTGIND